MLVISVAIFSILFLAGILAINLKGNKKNQTITTDKTTVVNNPFNNTNPEKISISEIKNEVLPDKNIILPAKWGYSVKKLVDSGSLNISFLTKILRQNGYPMTTEELKILNGTSQENITINATDSPFLLYVLWDIGINNNNTIIREGPITQYGNISDFASTGGYGPLGKLDVGGSKIVNLAPKEQEITDYVALNSYRPCCNNPTMMPDCNHGAAALGLIELMASQGNNATAIFKAVEEFNSFQFRQQYVEIAIYLKSEGLDFDAVPASQVVGSDFSSAAGFANVHGYINEQGLITEVIATL